MLEQLRVWLNSKCDYFVGVAIYSKLGSDARLYNLFKKGPTDFTTKRLKEELTAIYIVLTAKENVNTEESNVRVRSVVVKPQAEPQLVIPNTELYESCKKQADVLYKEIMNKRAELFSLARHEEFTNINTPDLIAARQQLAIDVVTGFQKVSALYDKADYVRIHGRLPDQDPGEEVNEYDALPDHLVKQTLDNLRKNYNKMKKRPDTPDRVALLQKHFSNIKKLEARWLLLKPIK